MCIRDRTAASLFGLMRNLGGSVGIAIVMALLARNMQISHADLAAQLTPFSLPTDPALLQRFGASGAAGMAMLDDMVTREAVMIAYLDDFHLLMMATLATVPLLLWVRPRPRHSGAEDDRVHMVME